MQIRISEIKIDAFAVLCGLRREGNNAFFLDSSLHVGEIGQYSFVGADPFLTFSCKGDNCCIKHRDGRKENFTDNPFLVLKRLLGRYSAPVHPKIPFTGGAVGFFGYDLCHFIEKLPRTAVDDIGNDDCFFAFYDGIYAVEVATGKISMIALGFGRSEEETLDKLENDLLAIAGQSKERVISSKPGTKTFDCNMTKPEYLSAVQKIREYIRAGDIYQANFTQRFSCPYHGNPLSLYETLRSLNPAPFAAFLDTGECVIASSSPERLAKVRNGVIETRPIKGTIARGKTAEEDEKQSLTLLNSEKDRSELLMIVDLERNDLSKVAQKGTVRVEKLFAIETYATVHHFVAVVTASVSPECDLIDCVRAIFPGGSITGAPKIRAMEIIDELEPTQRNVYTGAIGYLGFDGSMDLNIAIRTILIKDNKAYFQAGGGIVWDSVPESEYQESLLKGHILGEALKCQEEP
ncbi:MAG: aminodeoxychorismate synthase component I [Acidaminococcaceae bacterium]